MKTDRKVNGKKFKVSKTCCSKMCFLQIDANTQETIRRHFWDAGDKNIQDTLMLSLIDKRNISRISNETRSGMNSTYSYIYHLKRNEKGLWSVNRYSKKFCKLLKAV